MVLPTRVVTKPNQSKRAKRVALTIGVGLVRTLFLTRVMRAPLAASPVS